MPAAALLTAGAGNSLTTPHHALLKQTMIHFLALTQVPAKGAATDPVPWVLGMDGALPPSSGLAWGWSRVQTLNLARLASNAFPHVLVAELCLGFLICRMSSANCASFI